MGDDLIDWNAANYTGDLAVHVLATPGDGDGNATADGGEGPPTCSFRWSLAGQDDGSGFGASVRLKWLQNGEPERLNNTARTRAPHGHVGPAATPVEAAVEQRWALGGERDVPVEADTTFTAVGKELAPWDDDGERHPALALDVTCEGEVDLQVGMSTSHVVAFTSQGLRGGTGATLGLPPDGSMGVHANGADEIETDIPTPRALVEIRETPRDQEAVVKEGRLTLQHPNGTETRTFGTDPIDPVEIEGGPGTYRLTVDRISVGPASFHGSIVGLEPVRLPSLETPSALDSG